MINKFANGATKSISHDKLDTLALLTGIYPPAHDLERRWRIRFADEWLKRPGVRAKQPDIRRYVLKREIIRQVAKTVREYEEVDRQDPR